MLPLFWGRRDREREQLDELLSAYLDGELSEAERVALDARLSQDSALRAELRAMHHTISLVRELPTAPPPRNFLVTRSMVEKRKPAEKASLFHLEPEKGGKGWLAPVLTAASAVASLLFVIVLFGDLLLPGVGGLASAPAPVRHLEEPERMELEAGPTQEVEARGVEPPEQASPSPLAPQAEDEKLMVEEESTAAAATRAAEAPAGMGEGPPAEEGAAGDETAVLPAPTASPTLTTTTDLTPTVAAEAPTLSEGELDWVAPTPDHLVVTPQVDQHAAEAETLEVGGRRWTALEISLGLVSLGLIAATIQAWRRREQ